MSYLQKLAQTTDKFMKYNFELSKEGSCLVKPVSRDQCSNESVENLKNSTLKLIKIPW